MTSVTQRPSRGAKGTRSRHAAERGSSRPDRGTQPLEARIRDVYTQLSAAERRLADVMLERQRDLVGYTAGELAAEAGVSNATAARLVRTLGYRSYGDAKRQVRGMQHWGSPRAGLSDPDAAPASGTSVERMAASDIENIRATVAGLRPDALAGAVAALAGARRIWILGLRNGYGLAHHAAHYLGLLKPDVQVVPAGGATYAHAFASIVPGDAVLAIGFRRRPRLLPTLLGEARAAGAVAILLTDVSAAASARAADHVLRCYCHSPAPFTSFIAAVTVINYLAWAVAARLGEDSLRRFRRIDALVGALDDVSQPQATPRRATEGRVEKN